MNKIMVVEDDLTSQTLLATLLRFEGYEVLIPHEISMEAISSAIQTNQPDLVLMDVHLKKVNGLNILQMIRSTEHISDVFVIITSGEDWSYECKKFGANSFLMKPYMPDDLILAIKHLLEPK